MKKSGFKMKSPIYQEEKKEQESLKEGEVTDKELILSSTRESLAEDNMKLYGVARVKVNETINPETNEPFSTEEFLAWEEDQTEKFLDWKKHWEQQIIFAEEDQERIGKRVENKYGKEYLSL